MTISCATVNASRARWSHRSRFTRPRNASDFRFLKVSRVKPKGIAVLSIAAATAAGGRMIRVAYSGMAPMPMRALAVERALEGKPLDEASVDQALLVATEGTSPATMRSRPPGIAARSCRCI